MAVRELKQQLPWIGRVGTPGMLMGRTTNGNYVRSGTLSGIGEFSMHGMGCLVERRDGALIDFSWDGRGRVVFDGYRLRRFGRSIGAAEIDEQPLAAVCNELAEDGRLIVMEHGLFSPC